MSITATISGSFNKFLKEINNKIEEFNKNNIEVLSPKVDNKNYVEKNFVFLEGDSGTTKEIELRHLSAISRSDFLYVVNPKGYLGNSTCLEIGYALSKGIPIFSLEKIEDPPFSEFIVHAPTVSSVKEKLTNIEPVLEAFTLYDLQKYVRKIVTHRGFEEETLKDVLVLLVEEIGELAKAIRKETGLKVNVEEIRKSKSLQNEVADCLIYLIDLANLSGIDLQNALATKEKLNRTRTWKTKRDIKLGEN